MLTFIFFSYQHKMSQFKTISAFNLLWVGCSRGKKSVDGIIYFFSAKITFGAKRKNMNTLNMKTFKKRFALFGAINVIFLCFSIMAFFYCAPVVWFIARTFAANACSMDCVLQSHWLGLAWSFEKCLFLQRHQWYGKFFFLFYGFTIIWCSVCKFSSS